LFMCIKIIIIKKLHRRFNSRLSFLQYIKDQERILSKFCWT